MTSYKFITVLGFSLYHYLGVGPQEGDCDGLHNYIDYNLKAVTTPKPSQFIRKKIESFKLIRCSKTQIMGHQLTSAAVLCHQYPCGSLDTNSSSYFEVEMYWCSTESQIAMESGEASIWLPSKNTTNALQSKEVT